jgi:glycosyltransferase involved in cell wall biosynthesis
VISPKYSFPSKTMEYMASGKPVVMYKLDGIPDEYDEYLFYADGSNGIEGLATKLKEVLNNYDSALVKAECAKEFVLNNKNAKVQAKRILDFVL